MLHNMLFSTFVVTDLLAHSTLYEFFGYISCNIFNVSGYVKFGYITCYITVIIIITRKKLYNMLYMPLRNPDPLWGCHV